MDEWPHTRQVKEAKMNKTSIVAAAAIGMMALATGTYALAAERNQTPSAVVRTNSSDVTLMPGTGASTLRLHFSGAEIITQESPGGLMIVKAKGRQLHYRPVVVQFGKIDRNAPVILKRGAVMYDQPDLM